MSMNNLESRIAAIRDVASRGGYGATMAARDAAMIVEFALRELLRRHRSALAEDKQREVNRVIENYLKGGGKGGRAKGIEDMTLGQLVGVIRDTSFFEAWSAATGKPLKSLKLIDLSALVRTRNQELMHLTKPEQIVDPAEQWSPRDIQFLLYCIDNLVTTFGILSLEDAPTELTPERIADLPPPAESPYLGLEAFSAQQRHLFFGREADCARLLKTIRSQPFAVLVGNSGSGKSSLVAAGLLPGLPAEEWFTLNLRPREDLIDQLAGTVLPHLYPDSVEQGAERNRLVRLLAEPDYRLDHLLERLVGNGSRRRILLIVDQFEEVFTLCADRQRQSRAVDLLLSALHAGESSPVTLLLVLRADFFGRCLDFASLQQAFTRWPEMGATRPPRLLRGQWQSEIRVIGG